jgi:hypothetical protein
MRRYCQRPPVLERGLEPCPVDVEYDSRVPELGRGGRRARVDERSETRGRRRENMSGRFSGSCSEGQNGLVEGCRKTGVCWRPLLVCSKLYGPHVMGKYLLGRQAARTVMGPSCRPRTYRASNNLAHRHCHGDLAHLQSRPSSRDQRRKVKKYIQGAEGIIN